MKPITGITQLLQLEASPLLTDYRLAQLVIQIYKNSDSSEIASPLKKNFPKLADYCRYRDELMQSGILIAVKEFPQSAFTLLGSPKLTAAEIACLIDPFCYISHLSAMDYHGISERLPTTLFLSTPNHPAWKQEARKRMEKDLGDLMVPFLKSRLPHLRPTRFVKIKGQTINVSHSKHRGAYINASDSILRVSSIGRTFLDMLRNPELCGGMHHVIDKFTQHASSYLNLIVDEIDRNGASIDKVRAGYLLDEVAGIKNDRVEAWTKFVQRGGSRKLDPGEPYQSQWSEKWCLSLNAG